MSDQLVATLIAILAIGGAVAAAYVVSARYVRGGETKSDRARRGVFAATITALIALLALSTTIPGWLGVIGE